MLARMSSTELTEWLAYERVAGTLGPERDDFLHAITASTIANVNRGKGKAPAKGTRFMPRWDRSAQGWQDQLAAVREWNRALGGVDRTGDGPSRKEVVAGGDPVESPRPHRRRRRQG